MQLILIWAVSLIIAAGAAYLRGHEDGSAGQSEALAECRAAQKTLNKQLSEAIHAKTEAGRSIAGVVTQGVAAQTKTIQGVVDNAIAEINNAKRVSNACMLPGSFRVWHDFAAKANGVGTTTGVNVATDPIDCFTFVETVVRNYGTCNKNASNQAGLQKWVRDTGKLINEPREAAQAKEPKQ